MRRRPRRARKGGSGICTWAWQIGETTSASSSRGSSFPGPPRLGLARACNPAAVPEVHQPWAFSRERKTEKPEEEVEMERGPQFSLCGGTVLLDRSVCTGVFVPSSLGLFIVSSNTEFLYFKVLSKRRKFNNNKTGFLQSASPSCPCALSCSPEATKPPSTPRAASGVCSSISE